MTLKNKYLDEIRLKLKEELGLSSLMAVPRVVKVTVNAGVKEALTDKKVLDSIGDQLALICGQKPVITLAKKSVAAFKLRQGQPVGIMATLRGRRMFDFLEKFLTVVLPKIKDFHGLSASGVDLGGNFSIGISDPTVFPEIDAGKLDKTHSLQVVITTNTSNNVAGLALLKALGFPFKK